MAIPKTPNQKSQYGKLNKRLAQYVSLVQLLYEKYNKRAAQIALSDGYKGNDEYHFDSTISKKLIRDVQTEFVSELRTLIYSGITKEWKNSNQIQDLLADKVLDFYEVTNKKGEKYKKYYQTNSDALKAFKQRRDSGLNLSQKLWKQADEYKTALEETISTAIQRGNSAVALSKRVSQYLLDFDKMRSDYTNKFGKKSKALDCEYKSIRLARSEINMAYRTAEQERWRQMDFILGYEIKLSNAHKVKDVCDCLAGKYPKDFNWTGWHPNDMCYAVPIIMSDEQFWGFDEDGNKVEDTPRYVHDVPAGFKHWVEDNNHRIKIADSRGTLPYFLRDNKVFYSSKPLKEIADNSSVVLKRIESDYGKSTKRIVITPKQERLRDESYKAIEAAKNNPTKENIAAAQDAFEKMKDDKSDKFLSINCNGVDSVGDILKEYYAQYPDEFKNGYNGVVYRFADGVTRASTDCNGTFDIFGDLRTGIEDAMRKIQKGIDLSQYDEKNLNTLYHEIRHNTVGRYGYPDKDPRKYLCEIVHQFVSLYDYPRFVENIGGKAINQSYLINNIDKLGYGDLMTTLRNQLVKYGVDEKRFVLALKAVEDANPNIRFDVVVDVIEDLATKSFKWSDCFDEFVQEFENVAKKYF